MPYFPLSLHCFAWKKLTNFPANQVSSHILTNKKHSFNMRETLTHLMAAWEKACITAIKEGKYNSNPLLLWSAHFTEIPRQNPYMRSATLFNVPILKPLGMLTARQLDNEYWMNACDSINLEGRSESVLSASWGLEQEQDWMHKARLSESKTSKTSGLPPA